MWLRIAAYSTPAPPAAGWERDAVDLMGAREGYRGGQWGRDPQTGTYLAVTGWSTREALDAIEADLADLHARRRTQGMTLLTTATLRLISTRLSWSPQEWASTSGRRSRTWVRIAFYRPAQPDPAYVAESTDETVFLLRGVSGFRVGYWGVDDRTGAMAAITYLVGAGGDRRGGGAARGAPRGPRPARPHLRPGRECGAAPHRDSGTPQ